MANIVKSFDHVYPPRRARVHEVYGAGAYSFLVGLCAHECESVIWIYDGQDKMFYYGALASFALADRLRFVHMRDPKTQLWCMEEALASSAVGLVICERQKPTSFRDMRRLQLAAERGQAIGIFMISERFASSAAETRWRCEPLYSPKGHALQKWRLEKNKQGILGEWEVSFDEATHRVTVV